MSLSVTFDTNVFQHVIWPGRFTNDRDPGALQAVHNAIESKGVTGYVADPIAHVEQIQKSKRSSYFAGLRTVIANSEQVLPDGTIKLSVKVAPDPGAHPGLPGVLVDCIKAAVAMGVTILRCPRTAIPMAPEIQQAWYTPESNPAQTIARQDLFASVLREIENRGVGIAVLKRVGLDFLQRDNKTGEWYDGLAQSRDMHDEGRIKKAWAEWADGDAIAAHIAYNNDLFCTRDEAVSAGISIFNESNLTWLQQTYGVVIVSPTSLAQRVAR